MSTVTLYTRRGCCLCDEARATLERLRATTAFRLELIDIETDDALHRRYLERIPVVAVDGVEVCDLEVDKGRVVARLE